MCENGLIAPNGLSGGRRPFKAVPASIRSAVTIYAGGYQAPSDHSPAPGNPVPGTCCIGPPLATNGLPADRDAGR